MHLPWQPTAPAPVRRAGWAVAVAAVLAATVWWSMPALRAQLEPEAAPVLDPDVCVVAPPTPYNPASGLPLESARPVPADVRCPVCGMFPARSPQPARAPSEPKAASAAKPSHWRRSPQVSPAAAWRRQEQVYFMV